MPVQLSYDGRRAVLRGRSSSADDSSPSGDRVMTFVSYRVVGQDVQATVRKLDGGTETRRWRTVDFAGNWERY